MWRCRGISPLKLGVPALKQLQTPATAPSHTPDLSSDSHLKPSLLSRRRPAGLHLAPLDVHVPQTFDLVSPQTCSTTGTVAEPSTSSRSCKDQETALEAKGYSLGAVVGSGSMAKVYKATRRSDDRAFAVKRVCSLDEELRRVTRAEYSMLRGIRHDSIIHVEALFESHFCLWMVIEWCEDGDMQAFVEKHGAFHENRAEKLLLQLIEGVDCLHRKRITHRDLKPANLFLKHGATTLKIGDFNSATQLSGGESPGSSSRFAMLSQRGTPLYSAPEIRFGRDWNERADIWALGLCGYFMLQARLPFDVGNPVVTKALESGVLPEVPWGCMSEHLKGLLTRCLSVDMRSRPAAMELLAQLPFHRTGGPRDCSAAARGSRRHITDPRGSRQPSQPTARIRVRRSCTR